ncbi:hypothetical protein E2C01_053672 [Portunus trituberculatus]|uniref:Uncharacterized protein n=1 Tax=Portunus trituberculatus TaxID=210409 RepID=A0A5B7GRG1_PORTR|nr:hypothetical protein [Portunus trituberculatus]
MQLSPTPSPYPYFALSSSLSCGSPLSLSPFHYSENGQASSQCRKVGLGMTSKDLFTVNRRLRTQHFGDQCERLGLPTSEILYAVTD